MVFKELDNYTAKQTMEEFQKQGRLLHYAVLNGVLQLGAHLQICSYSRKVSMVLTPSHAQQWAS